MRNVSLDLDSILQASCTLDAVGYLSLWAYTSYDTVALRQVGTSNDISAFYTLSGNPDKKYFIMAVFDEDTKKYSFHS